MKFFHADMSLLIDEMGQFSTWFHDLILKKKERKEDIDSTNLGSQSDKEELPDYVCTTKDAINLTKILLYMHRWMDLRSQANTPPGIKGKKNYMLGRICMWNYHISNSLSLCSLCSDRANPSVWQSQTRVNLQKLNWQTQFDLNWLLFSRLESGSRWSSHTEICLMLRSSYS